MDDYKKKFIFKNLGSVHYPKQKIRSLEDFMKKKLFVH